MKPSQSKFIAIVCVVALTLSGCCTLSKVETNTTNEKEFTIKEVHDTLLLTIHDSVYHTIFQKGDTIYDTKYIERTRWRDRTVERVDTFVRDSVVTNTVEKVVERKITPAWCYWTLVGLFACLTYFIIRLILWLKK